MNDDNTYIHKYYAHFLSSKNNENVSPGQNMIILNDDFATRIYYFEFIIK